MEEETLMKEYMCPYCDQRMKKKHRCDNCHSFVWKPVEIESHPEVFIDPQDDPISQAISDEKYNYGSPSGKLSEYTVDIPPQDGSGAKKKKKKERKERPAGTLLSRIVLIVIIIIVLLSVIALRVISLFVSRGFSGYVGYYPIGDGVGFEGEGRVFGFVGPDDFRLSVGSDGTSHGGDGIPAGSIDIDGCSRTE